MLPKSYLGDKNLVNLEGYTLVRSGKMAVTDSIESWPQQQKLQKQQAHRLERVAHQWNHDIQNGLKRLAQSLWPNGRVLGVIPAPRYRLRRRVTPGAYAWWIEHDIPPYDRYRCAAYRVLLSLNNAGKPSLIVESGAATHPVKPLTPDRLKAVLAQAGDDLPLLIPREMGRADDP